MTRNVLATTICLFGVLLASVAGAQTIPYSTEDARFKCGDVPIGHWTSTTKNSQDWAFVITANDRNAEDEIYRVCNWNAKTKAFVRTERNDAFTPVTLFPKSCVDVRNPINVSVTSENDGENVFGFYCRIN